MWSGLLVAVTSREDALSAQLTYYCLRAGQYDRDHWRDPATIGHLESVLAELGPAGRTLELACGTGFWTALLAGRVPEVTAIDGSAEMLDLARRRLGDVPVTFVEADLFRWRPDDSYDTVFFAFWLSHVPPSLFEAFWGTVADALARGGRVLFVDTGPEEARHEHFVATDDIPTVERQLLDGSTHRVVKVLYEPADLERRLAALGWQANVNPAGGTFFAGSATLVA
jgi:ubiquinone/menaquinone biosynthesis C-methylase UbiE